MQRNLLRTLGALSCSVGLLLTAAAGMGLVYADTGVGSLTLFCEKDGVVLENLEWDLYRVGSRDGDVFVTDGEFAEYSIIIDDFSTEGMNEAAKTLENIALLDEDIQPIQSGATNENGVLIFSNLMDGLYLVSGSVLEVGDTVYVPSTMLFEISGEHETMDWNAYPKIEYRTQSNEEINFAVKKVWLNEDGEPCDPTMEITVEIYRDLELYETVVLSDENNWTYEWTDLDKYQWRVQEVIIPEGFTVVYESNETQYLIKNIYHPTEETGTTTSTTATTTTTTTTHMTTATDEILPPTGQLWWPVIVMGLFGLIFIALGCRFLAARNEE